MEPGQSQAHLGTAAKVRMGVCTFKSLNHNHKGLMLLQYSPSTPQAQTITTGGMTNQGGPGVHQK